MCVLCAPNAGFGDAARRLRVLRLLALVEHPDALPPGAVLRLSQEIMALIGSTSGRLRCDPMTADGMEGGTA